MTGSACLNFRLRQWFNVKKPTLHSSVGYGFKESYVTGKYFRERLSLGLVRSGFVIFPVSEGLVGNFEFCRHFRLGQVSLIALQDQMISKRLRLDREELSRAEFLV